jgi:hypothetical protein
MVLAVLGMVCLTACEVTPEDVRPACELWAEIKASIEAGEPQVAFAADAVERVAEESNIPRLRELAADLNKEVSRWLATDAEAGRPFGPELTKAIDAFERYCGDKDAPVR